MKPAASSPAPRAEARQGTDGAGVRCWRCGAEQEPAPLCCACQAVLPLPPGLDHYQVLGLPRRLTFDAEELARRYYELSRLLHPDRHTSDPAAAREASTQNTAALTRAHRTLRDPVARALYWLELHGEKLGDDNRVPAALAALVFAVQEKLEELRRAQHIERQKQAAEVRHELADLKSRHDELSRRLQANFCRWDEPGADRKALLAELKSILSQRAYLATLIRDASATLDGGAVEPAAAGERHSRG